MDELIIITLDPGHGGASRSNVGPTGYVEADGALDICWKIKRKLEATGRFKVILTREKDMTLSLEERARIASANKSYIFISYHTNAGPAGAFGTEVFYSVDLPNDKGFATNMCYNTAVALKTTDRKAKVKPSTNDATEDYYGIIDWAQDLGIPHVLLVEAGFHSDPTEEKKLKQDSFRDAIAEAGTKTICSFCSIVYPVVAPAPKPAPVPDPIPQPTTPKTSILGTETVTVEQCEQFIHKTNPQAINLAALYKKYGEKLGIKWGYAFAQMVKETAYLKFGGDVQPYQNNFAGVGAVGGGAGGASFITPEEGVLAHLEHLFAYASSAALPTDLPKVDPRFDLVKRAVAPNWEDLNGKWAVPGDGYGENIVSIHNKIAAEVIVVVPKVDPEIERVRKGLEDVIKLADDVKKKAEEYLASPIFKK